MAVTTTTYSIPLTYKITEDTDLDQVGVEHLTGGSATLHHIEIIQPNNEKVYVKLYNSADITVGTTAPVLVLLVPAAGAGTRYAMEIPGGLVFSTGISWACTQTAGVGGTTAPTGSAITVRMMNS